MDAVLAVRSGESDGRVCVDAEDGNRAGELSSSGCVDVNDAAGLKSDIGSVADSDCDGEFEAECEGECDGEYSTVAGESASAELEKRNEGGVRSGELLASAADSGDWSARGAEGERRRAGVRAATGG